MNPARLSYLFAGSFLVAVFVLQWWQRPNYPVMLYVIIGVCGLLARTIPLLVSRWLVSRSFGQPATSQRATIYTIPAIFGILLALFTVSFHTHVPSPSTLDTYASGKQATVTGIIDDIPDKRALFSRYVVRAQNLQFKDGADIPIDGRTLVVDRGGWPEFEYGDVIVVEGTLERPEASDTFAYDRYLAVSGIHSIVRANHIERISSGKGNPVRAFLYYLRTTTETQINRLYPEPHAALLAGLLLGARRSLPEHLTDAFNTTGLSHIVAISGYNITMIITVLGALFSFLPNRPRHLVTVAIIIAFTLLVGASASAVRAAIMGGIGILALESGRMQTPRLTILWTATLMLLWNPLLLRDDAGFQLSFLAIIGLTEALPALRSVTKRVPDFFGMRDTLTTTLAAQIFAIPWLALTFGQLPLVSPVSNVIVLPFVPYATLLGAVATALSFISFPLGLIVSYVCWLTMECIIRFTELFAALPFASIAVPHLSMIVAVLYYVCVFAALWFHRYRKRDVVLPSHGNV
ncbi:ComEC family competence protein [Candidatus Uhrbacteria bacterium]|nr:ComEC family competence protein [Candidatus Uhrbacteria bacterium]